ncbi:MAG: hypothetical protein WCO10_03615 [bacterium]
MQVLSKIFGGEARVKVMRLFLFNPENSFFIEQIANRARISEKEAWAEVELLEKSEMVKSRSTSQILEQKKRGKMVEVKRKAKCWQLNSNFEYLAPMKNLLISTRPLRGGEILKKLGSVGKLKLVIVSGVFIQDKDSRVDMLVVGDNLKKGTIDRILKNMEAEIGKEVNYATFETIDFQYRLGMCDKLIRDILDYPHQKLLDKTGMKLDSRVK